MPIDYSKRGAGPSPNQDAINSIMWGKRRPASSPPRRASLVIDGQEAQYMMKMRPDALEALKNGPATEPRRRPMTPGMKANRFKDPAALAASGGAPARGTVSAPTTPRALTHSIAHVADLAATAVTNMVAADDEDEEEDKPLTRAEEQTLRFQRLSTPREHASASAASEPPKKSLAAIDRRNRYLIASGYGPRAQRVVAAPPLGSARAARGGGREPPPAHVLQMQLRHSWRIGKPVPARYNVGGEEEEGVMPSPARGLGEAMTLR